ncbi:MFS general substrate transporter [Terfezia boudieri ATCC MYA-4762]|uniref:MFS general substrate transporter n=1 Tax=Terfezia boudieri ATCC MYA-4762 TaxID=1051890 RepID=A0A3N4LEI6_9PEZI|nr:MFS general substrate transporter [Terfezia boudieri ATCC MYA-4762]
MDPPREPTTLSIPLSPVPPNAPSIQPVSSGSAATITDVEKVAVNNVYSSACEHKPHNPRPTAEELKHLQRRIDLRIIPICSFLYLLCFICRQNIGNAKTFHMLETLPATSHEYQLALTAFFFTYSTFDVPCNILLRKVGPKKWLPLITLLSGVVTACMGVVHNADSLIGVRAVLGMTECGLFPGVAMIITMWYVKKEAQFRQALFFCAASMAGAFTGLLAVGLKSMDGQGNYEGWRWILIIEGIVTVVAACIAFFVVQNPPAIATFLSERDRSIITHRLRNDEFGLKDDGSDDENPDKDIDEEYIRGKLTEYRNGISHSKSKLLKLIFGKWHIYAHIMVFYGISAPMYSISLCLPTILTQLSPTTTPTRANLLTIPIYVTACIFSLTTAFASDRTGKRAPFILGAYITMFIGFLLALVRPARIPALAYVGVFIAACGIYPAFPGMITWYSNNIGGGEKVRAVSMAFHIGMGSFGGAMGANFYSSATKGPQSLYRVGHALNLAFVTAGLIAVLTLWWRYRAVNKKRDEQRQALRARFEEEVAIAKEKWVANKGVEEGWKENERFMRREFELKREIELVEHGEGSVWFEYTI